MRKLLLALSGLLFLAMASGAHAQTCPGAGTADYVMGREAITISSTALGFTAATFAPTGGPVVKYAYVRLETANIRVSTDGIAPTSSVGQLVETTTNAGFWVCGQTNVKLFKAIRTTVDAAITAVYYSASN